MPDCLLPYVFILLFLIIWVVVIKIVSTLSGWRDLAGSYQAEQPFSGERFRFQSARMRAGMSYNSVLTVGADIYGFYLSVFLPFRFGHPALFIPWEEVSGKPGRLFFAENREAAL